jgi:hypothetical protein
MTIDDNLLLELKDRSVRLKRPLKQVVNETLRAGLDFLRRPQKRAAYKCRSFSMGYPPLADLRKALMVAEAMEDEEFIRKIEIRK